MIRRTSRKIAARIGRPERAGCFSMLGDLIGCDTVLCGHTHLEHSSVADGISHFNSGSWCEQPCVYLTIEEGKVESHHFTDAFDEANEGSYFESQASYLDSA